MRNALLVAALLVPALAGCLSDGTDSIDGKLPLENVDIFPWYTNLTTLSAELTIDIDPTVAPEVTSSTSNHDGPVVTGEGVYEVKNLGFEPLDYLNFFGAFTLTSVVGDAGIELPFEGRNITLSAPLAPGATTNVSIAFEGRPGNALVPVSGAEEFSAFSFDAAPYTTGWIEPASMRATVTSPVDWTVLIAASLVDEQVNDLTITRQYEGRVSYLDGYSSDGLLRLTDEVNGVLIETFFFPSQTDQGHATHETAVKIFRNVPEWTGPYPFNQLWTVPHSVSVNAFSLPAINNMGWTFYRPAFSDAPVQFGRDLIPIFGHGQNSMENVMVHETIHNWWGHDVRGNNSSPNQDGERDTWMTEGITTYLAETVWFDRLYGEEAARDSAEHMVRALTQGRVAGGQEFSTTESGGDYYVKGAMSMRALEAYGLATDRPDFSLELLQFGLETYGRQFGGPGHADTIDFVKTMEEGAGEDLSWWYNAWHYSGDLADFQVADVTTDTAEILVTVDNLGDARGAALVEVEMAGGQTLRAWGIADPQSSTEITIPLNGLGGAVVRATVDPLQHIYEMDETNNQWAATPAP